MKFVRIMLLAVSCLAVTGCHCLPCVERYNSRIDGIADQNANLNGFRFSRLDVTRIGKPDGPRCFRCNCNTCY